MLVAVGSTLYLILAVSPEVQTSNILVYVAICSIVGSLSGARSQGRGRPGIVEGWGGGAIACILRSA